MKRIPVNGIQLSILLSILTMVAIGCGGVSSQPAAKADAQAAPPRDIAMQGEASYFNGSVDVTVSVSRGFSAGLDRRRQRAALEKQPKLREVFEKELSDSTKYNQAETFNKMVALVVRDSPIPPVLIHVELENRGPAPVEVEIVELNSELGNFAVRPSILTIASGAVGEPDPMTSRLGVTSADIPVKVVLRVNGQDETQTLRVRELAAPAAPKQ